MGLLGRITNAFRKQKPNDKPPIYGGDGLSNESPAIVNCASMGMAQALIDRFISERCGEEWERGVEMTLASRNDPDKSIQAILVKLPDGTENRFYFDLSRPVSVAMKMSGMGKRQAQTNSRKKLESEDRIPGRRQSETPIAKEGPNQTNEDTHRRARCVTGNGRATGWR